jgi:hypothetical protein
MYSRTFDIAAAQTLLAVGRNRSSPSDHFSPLAGTDHRRAITSRRWQEQIIAERSLLAAGGDRSPLSDHFSPLAGTDHRRAITSRRWRGQIAAERSLLAAGRNRSSLSDHFSPWAGTNYSHTKSIDRFSKTVGSFHKNKNTVSQACNTMLPAVKK